MFKEVTWSKSQGKKKPGKRTYDVVLRDGFFQIAAKINAFPTTAIGARSEITTKL